MLQYAKQGEQFNRKLSQFQAIRQKLVDMKVSIEAARWLTYKAAFDYDQGMDGSGSMDMAQLEVGMRSTSVVDEAIQIFGVMVTSQKRSLSITSEISGRLGWNLGPRKNRRI